MDGSSVEHSSDSESGESWTLLDNTPVYADEVPEFTDNPHINERDISNKIIEKDDDTDGISIITDSDPESLGPCEISFERFLSEKDHPTEQHNPQCISVNSLPSNINEHHESIRSGNELFVGPHNNHGKHKTYVHRRNKRLSTVLNIIMLGSVITAAGVAIGHMWGAKNDCTIHATPSVNKILSTLYKLQEENEYLRNKVKELTLANNIEIQQRKSGTESMPHKLHRCKKVYEEPLSNKSGNKVIKCIDNDINIAEKNIENHPPTQPAFEQDFLNDIEKMKLIYHQNKSWLDVEIDKRIKGEKHLLKRMKNSLKSTNLISIDEEQKDSQLKDLINPESETITETLVHADTYNSDSKINDDNLIDVKKNELLQTKKISYADSVKSDQQAKVIQKRETKGDFNDDSKEYNKKRMKKIKKNTVTTLESPISEVDLKKDDRYVGRKSRQETKKHDRQKSHKKQKRKNKYDLWEIKGDFMMKDYDDYSESSSQDNNIAMRKPDKNLLSTDFQKINYDDNKSIESFDIISKKGDTEKPPIQNHKEYKKSGKNKEFNWYDNRSASRTEARKMLEHELLGETSPNNARWYFRRMQRREQCRAKGDNSTHRKLSKRNMNYKMKH